MDELQQLFRDAVPGRIAELEAALASPAAHDHARRVAHMLRGSGGTYGFPEVSAAAEAAEHAPPEELGARVGALIAALRSTLAAVGRDTGAAPVDMAGAGATVLLVDDDPEIRLLAGVVLRRAGYTVHEAASSAEALAAVARGHFAVLVIDVLLGEEDGVDVARRLLDACASPPALIFLTGVTGAGHMTRMAALSPAAVITKPFDPEALAPLVARASGVAP